MHWGSMSGGGTFMSSRLLYTTVHLALPAGTLDRNVMVAVCGKCCGPSGSSSSGSTEGGVAALA